MANKPLKSIKFPGLDDVYTVPQLDDTLTMAGHAADAKKTGDEFASLKSALGKDEITSLLLADPIPDTVQAITFDANGNVQTITHSRDGAAVRTDAFVFADGSITETRTLATGESLTIVTNTDTLITTSTYAEETA